MTAATAPVSPEAKSSSGNTARRTYFAVADHLGSKRAIIDADSSVQARFDFDPYGMVYADSPANCSKYRYLYTGQEYEPELGIYNYRARMYDPLTGRFISPDPVRQTFSPYAYCGDNPVVFTDPTGMVIGAIGREAARLIVLRTFKRRNGFRSGSIRGRITSIRAKTMVQRALNRRRDIWESRRHKRRRDAAAPCAPPPPTACAAAPPLQPPPIPPPPIAPPLFADQPPVAALLPGNGDIFAGVGRGAAHAPHHADPDPHFDNGDPDEMGFEVHHGDNDFQPAVIQMDDDVDFHVDFVAPPDHQIGPAVPPPPPPPGAPPPPGYRGLGG